MNQTIKEQLKPCPFCGGTDFRIELGRGGKITDMFADNAQIKCQDCGCEFQHIIYEPEYFEQIEGDIYKKIPKKYAEEVLIEKWNRRIPQ